VTKVFLGDERTERGKTAGVQGDFLFLRQVSLDWTNFLFNIMKTDEIYILVVIECLIS
jgi:hypothetical protein